MSKKVRNRIRPLLRNILIIFLIIITVITFILVKIGRERDIATTKKAENLLPTIVYKPENLHDYLSDGSFKDLIINRSITYDAKKFNAKLVDFSATSESMTLLFPAGGRITVEVVNLKNDSPFSNSTYKLLKIGNNMWYIVKFNSEVTSKYYVLKGEKNYVTVNLIDTVYTDEGLKKEIAETEEFLSTVNLK